MTFCFMYRLRDYLLSILDLKYYTFYYFDLGCYGKVLSLFLSNFVVIPPVVTFIIKFRILRTIKTDNTNYYPPFTKLTYSNSLISFL